MKNINVYFEYKKSVIYIFYFFLLIIVDVVVVCLYYVIHLLPTCFIISRSCSIGDNGWLIDLMVEKVKLKGEDEVERS